MIEHAVVIAGAGPTGLMLAGELALAETDVIVIERRTNQDVDGSRAGGLHSRTIEVLDQRGIAERFLAEGQAVQVQAFAGIALDISDFPTRHNYGLALWQKHIERILAGWVAELLVPIVHGCDVVAFVQDDGGVEVELSDGQRIRAQYLVGCDGGRSIVRKEAGIDFAGSDPTTSWIIAEVMVDEEPTLGLRPGGGIGPGVDEGTVRVVLTEQEIDHTGDPTLQDLKDALVAEDGTDYGVHSPTWISRFTDMTRQATSYREGRVLLAGDAAHVHPPQGGQGLGTGVQDAVNLGWKLAQVIKGTSPDTLLDTYHAERHPIGARVLKSTMAQNALRVRNERTEALHDTLAELLGLDQARRQIAGMLSGLDIRYDLGPEHPLLGRRMPDLDLDTNQGPTRVVTLLHEARPVLLTFEASIAFDISPWSGRVQMVEATYKGQWELPVIGEVSAPQAVLIRPDGYVVWVGSTSDAQLPLVLAIWFGPPAPISS